MQDIKKQKVEVIVGFLEKIYKNNKLPYYPQTLEWTAELLLEKLEEQDILDFERQYEANLLSQDIPSIWERENLEHN